MLLAERVGERWDQPGLFPDYYLTWNRYRVVTDSLGWRLANVGAILILMFTFKIKVTLRTRPALVAVAVKPTLIDLQVDRRFCLIDAFAIGHWQPDSRSVAAISRSAQPLPYPSLSALCTLKPRQVPLTALNCERLRGMSL
jgi:hypothetical protein